MTKKTKEKIYLSAHKETREIYEQLIKKSSISMINAIRCSPNKAVIIPTWVWVTASGAHDDSLDLGPLLQQREQGTLHGAGQHLTVKVIPAEGIMIWRLKEFDVIAEYN